MQTDCRVARRPGGAAFAGDRDIPRARGLDRCCCAAELHAADVGRASPQRHAARGDNGGAIGADVGHAGGRHRRPRRAVTGNADGTGRAVDGIGGCAQIDAGTAGGIASHADYAVHCGDCECPGAVFPYTGSASGGGAANGYRTGAVAANDRALARSGSEEHACIAAARAVARDHDVAAVARHDLVVAGNKGNSAAAGAADRDIAGGGSTAGADAHYVAALERGYADEAAGRGSGDGEAAASGRGDCARAGRAAPGDQHAFCSRRRAVDQNVTAAGRAKRHGRAFEMHPDARAVVDQRPVVGSETSPGERDRAVDGLERAVADAYARLAPVAAAAALALERGGACAAGLDGGAGEPHAVGKVGGIESSASAGAGD